MERPLWAFSVRVGGRLVLAALFTAVSLVLGPILSGLMPSRFT